MKKIAVLLGASGSVGFEILKTLLETSDFEKVVIFVRKSILVSSLSDSSRLRQILVPEMKAESLTQAVSGLLRAEVAVGDQVQFMGFSALGVGAKTAALTIDQHRAVDVVLNQAFAQALKSSAQVTSLCFMSAVGSNPKAKATGSGAAGMPRYARVKGESEEAVKAHGPRVVSIFRPATILGSQHTPKALALIAPLFDFVIPGKYHSVSTRQIAQGMVGASLMELKESGTYHYAEMIEFGKRLRHP